MSGGKSKISFLIPPLTFPKEVDVVVVADADAWYALTANAPIAATANNIRIVVFDLEEEEEDDDDGAVSIVPTSFSTD